MERMDDWSEGEMKRGRGSGEYHERSVRHVDVVHARPNKERKVGREGQVLLLLLVLLRDGDGHVVHLERKI